MNSKAIPFYSISILLIFVSSISAQERIKIPSGQTLSYKIPVKAFHMACFTVKKTDGAALIGAGGNMSFSIPLKNQVVFCYFNENDYDVTKEFFLVNRGTDTAYRTYHFHQINWMETLLVTSAEVLITELITGGSSNTNQDALNSQMTSGFVTAISSYLRNGQSSHMSRDLLINSVMTQLRHKTGDAYGSFGDIFLRFTASLLVDSLKYCE